MSRPWSESTKRWVIVGLTVAGSVVLYKVRRLLPPVILALLLAYLLSPLVNRLTKARVSRTLATVLTYAIVLVGVGIAASILLPMVLQQVSSINVDLLAIYTRVLQVMSDYETITVLDYSVELSAIFEKLQDSLIELATGFASRSAEELLQISFGVASGFASTFVWLVFILVVSFWLIRDANKIMGFFRGLIPLDYREDVDGLVRSIADVWDSFFRGLVLLSLVVGAITGVAVWLVGVKNSLLLGILAGLLEVVPSVGPIIACIPAVAVAYFQGSTRLPITNGWFALLVLGLYAMIQQAENNYLAPRIISASVKTHPLVVLLGAIGGYSVGGILGAFLAAPVIGTSRVLGEYFYKKLTEVQLAPEATTPSEAPAAEGEAASKQIVADEEEDELS